MSLLGINNQEKENTDLVTNGSQKVSDSLPKDESESPRKDVEIISPVMSD
jgi:hypothetical protein